MATDLVIVAIPNEDDYVWKISSEKIPHMTLLFLGELGNVKNVASIAEFVTHAANTSLKRFGMEVQRRGTLGEDEADVLFFDKKWATEVQNFRHHLLQDNNVRTAYDSVEQFPEWLPHMTLGYPKTPAKEDDREYPGIHWVNFDKIGFWFGDYEGLEIPLKDYDWDMEVSMSTLSIGQAAVKDALAHYGVKGMKWGVRQKSGKATEAHVRTIKQRKHMKTKVAVRGGRGQPAVKEAIDVRVLQQTLKKSGPNALTNNQLQIMATRLNLEQNVSRLSNTKTNSVGKKWAQDELKKEGSRRISTAVAASVAKKAATAAAVAAV